MNRLRERIIAAEGLRLKPYRCTAGKLSIGCGRNLDDVGITKAEAYTLLDNDIARSTRQAQQFPWFWELDDVRQDAVIEMIFNLGLSGFQGFHRLIAALDDGDWERASEECLASKWREQVGRRAHGIAQMFLTGEYPKE